MTPQDRKAEVAERIEEMAHALFGLPRDERARAGAKEMAEMLVRIEGADLRQEEEPILPLHRREDQGNP
ncbi:MAG: hypothetical protein AABZ64_18145 [Nitrospinota bacterium]